LGARSAKCKEASASADRRGPLWRGRGRSVACTPLSTWEKQIASHARSRWRWLWRSPAILPKLLPQNRKVSAVFLQPFRSGGPDWEGFYDAHGGGTNDDKRKAGRVVVPAKLGGEACQLQDEMKVVPCDASPGDHRAVWDRMGHPWSAWEAAPQALGPAIASGSEAILGRRLAVRFVKD
jgi:hypothetical protein